MTKVKICGLTKSQDVEFANFSKPDFIGFVFAKSKRQISAEQAKLLKTNLSEEIKAVGVFVNHEIETIVKLVNDEIIDLIQLHGDEDENYVTKLKSLVNAPIIKAVRVGAQAITTPCVQSDFFLFDSYKENQYGGTGECFDWQVVNNCKKPFFLAGGLNACNVVCAIETVSPFCVDISSGVETNGAKDRKKIHEIVKIIRSVKVNE